jgi:hypothetical protein
MMEGSHSGDPEADAPLRKLVPTDKACSAVNWIRLLRFVGFTADYEECSLLRCITPVRTSQGTHYISVTEPSRLRLCTI